MRTIITVLIGAFLSFFPALQAQIKTYQGQVSIKQNNVEIKEHSLALDLDVCISNLPVGAHKSLKLYPMLKYGNDSLLLAPIILNGTNKQKMYLRQVAFQGEEAANAGAYTILEADPTLLRVISYQKTLNMRPWMKNAQFLLVGEFVGYHDNTEQVYINALTDSFFTKNN